MTINKDAQEKTIEALGLKGLVNELFTSSQVGLHKGNGLIEHALNAVSCPVDACVMIGDNLHRDIMPALAMNMMAIMINSKEGCAGALSTDTLEPIAKALKSIPTGQAVTAQHFKI